jgi:hypothetical protein
MPTRQRGLYGNVIRLTPPLCITRDDCAFLDECLSLVSHIGDDRESRSETSVLLAGLVPWRAPGYGFAQFRSAGMFAPL